MKKVLVEASGSMVSAFMIEAIREADCISVASDITEDAVGRYLAHDFIKVPCCTDPDLWEKQTKLVKETGIDVVFPSLDETLTGWAERKNNFLEVGINVVISPVETIDIFTDKWKAYQFFVENDIPTPKTSLEQKYPLVKPIRGRGAVGVRVEENSVPMEGLISQELLLGTEYTVDVLCDFQGKPVYIVPRVRKGVVEGKSTQGQVQTHAKIEAYVQAICETTQFHGPINLQCFELENGDIKFVEINPRIGGGMALAFAATENWVEVIVKYFATGQKFQPQPVRNGTRMYRYYKEVYA